MDCWETVDDSDEMFDVHVNILHHFNLSDYGYKNTMYCTLNSKTNTRILHDKSEQCPEWRNILIFFLSIKVVFFLSKHASSKAQIIIQYVFAN